RPPAKVSPPAKKRFRGDRPLGRRCFPSQEGLAMTGKRTVSMMMMAAAALAACDGINDPSEAGNLVPKTVDEDPTIPSLALAGTVFHYETVGDPSKPVIIFLHGGP